MVRVRAPLRVAEQVEQRVDALELVAGDGADRLLAHGALVRVTRRLVVVRVGDQPRAGAEDRQRVDLDVRVLRGDVDLEEMVMSMHFLQKQSCY